MGTIWLNSARYYGKDVDLVGKVKDIKIEAGQTYLELEGTGTRDDAVLRALTARDDRKFLVHICDEKCDKSLTSENLIHGEKFEEVSPMKELWFTNAVKVPGGFPEGEDELAALRREAVGADPGKEEGSPGTPKKKKREAEKEKDNKKKDAKEKKAREAEEETEAALELGQASLSQVFKGSGLDPDPKVRSSLTRKARKSQKKKKKKKKDSEASESTSSSSSSSASLGADGNAALFDNERKMKLIHRRFPGVLAACTLGEIRKSLMTTAGTLWDLEKGKLPPLFTQYVRQNLSSSMSAPMMQEALTIAHAVDGLLQGQVAGCCDVLTQRLKSLESTCRGAHWSVGRQMELIRSESNAMTDEAETMEAYKRAREEEKLRNLTSK